jgi:hypothetical protein
MRGELFGFADRWSSPPLVLSTSSRNHLFCLVSVPRFFRTSVALSHSFLTFG